MKDDDDGENDDYIYSYAYPYSYCYYSYCRCFYYYCYCKGVAKVGSRFCGICECRLLYCTTAKYNLRFVRRTDGSGPDIPQS